VAGNQTLDKTTANALRVLEFVGRADVPVAAGADRPLDRDLFIAAYVHGESGLDGPTLPPPRGTAIEQHAVDFLAEHILGSDRPVTVVPVGPLTNIALLLARYPETAGNVERIVLMGGAIAEGNVTPAAEFNIYVDPEAAWRVFRSGLPVTMIGLDVTHKALLTDPRAERLRASGEVGRLVAELYDFFVEYHRRTYETEGAPIHDAVAVAQVLRPGIVETRRRHVDVDCESRLCRGRTVVDLWRRTGEEPNVDVGVDVDAEGFLDLLCERLGSL
jgi:inosine-uridine nucleoside N-ribohydrolase